MAERLPLNAGYNATASISRDIDIPLFLSISIEVHILYTYCVNIVKNSSQASGLRPQDKPTVRGLSMQSMNVVVAVATSALPLTII